MGGKSTALDLWTKNVKVDYLDYRQSESKGIKLQTDIYNTFGSLKFVLAILILRF